MRRCATGCWEDHYLARGFSSLGRQIIEMADETRQDRSARRSICRCESNAGSSRGWVSSNVGEGTEVTLWEGSVDEVALRMVMGVVALPPCLGRGLGRSVAPDGQGLEIQRVELRTLGVVARYAVACVSLYSWAGSSTSRSQATSELFSSVHAREPRLESGRHPRRNLEVPNERSTLR
jgi:hypothetical protein